MNRLVLIMLFLLPALAGCSHAVQEGQQDQEGQSQDEENGRFQGPGFSIRFPGGWRVEELEDCTVIAHDKVLDKFRENVVVTSEELQEGTTLAGFFSKSRARLKEELPEYRELSTGELTAGAKAKWVTCTQKGILGPLKVQVYCLVKGRHAYCITCTAELNGFDNYKSTFEKIAKSFRIE
jgi:hypothetical protein